MIVLKSSGCLEHVLGCLRCRRHNYILDYCLRAHAAPVWGSQLLWGVLVPGLGVPAPQWLHQVSLRSAGSTKFPPDSVPFLSLEVRAASVCQPFVLLPNLSLMTIMSIYHHVTTPNKILVHLIPAVSEMNLKDITLSERSQTEKATHA
ncbi:unnamed protein product [Rangifer tarandus platyrhynchus]|uniref:Uncharacterized protein n=1 Tax=Rangifer tarandus platyrhynchus TaxID=3082113 RepID=A0ABN8XPB4_RANTA|nr:unnamed protein product [Rangifer tarandus platyrhynchus]